MGYSGQEIKVQMAVIARLYFPMLLPSTKLIVPILMKRKVDGTEKQPHGMIVSSKPSFHNFQQVHVNNEKIPAALLFNGVKLQNGIIRLFFTDWTMNFS